MKSDRTEGDSLITTMAANHAFFYDQKLKPVKTVLASSIFLGMSFSAAQAEVCFRLTPFIDIIRLAQITVQDDATGGTHTLLVGNWTADGVPSKPVVGSLDVSINPSGTRLGLHGTLHGNDCAGHSDVTLDGVPGGPWNLSCHGKVDGFFNNSGTLTVVSCNSLPTLTARAEEDKVTAERGKAATQP